MARKHEINEEVLVFPLHIATATDDVDKVVGRLPKDYVQVIEFTVVHMTAGTGAQNVTYTIKTAPAGSATADATLSAATGNVANATAGASGQALGTGQNQAALAEGRNLIISCNFAAAVTNGPHAVVIVRLRK